MTISRRAVLTRRRGLSALVLDLRIKWGFYLVSSLFTVMVCSAAVNWLVKL